MSGLVLIFVAALILLVRYGTRGGNGPPAASILTLPHRQVAFVVVTLCGISAVLWANCLASFNCVSESEILLSRGLFQAALIQHWDDVTEVSSECERARSGALYSRLILTLSDGTSVSLPFRYGLETADYSAAKAALAGKHCKYRLSTSVTPELCRAPTYQFLSGWKVD